METDKHSAIFLPLCCSVMEANGCFPKLGSLQGTAHNPCLSKVHILLELRSTSPLPASRMQLCIPRAVASAGGWVEGEALPEQAPPRVIGLPIPSATSLLSSSFYEQEGYYCA